MKKLIKEYRHEIVIAVIVLLVISCVRGWATARAYKDNYRMCQTNIEEIKDLYNSR